MTDTATVVTHEQQVDVGGVALAQPFKVRRLGHFGINCDAGRMDDVVRFYSELLGFRVSDVVDLFPALPAEVQRQVAKWKGTMGFFLTHGTDHHSLVLLPRQLFEGIRPTPPGVAVNQVTWQVGSLREVVEGIRWFGQQNRPVSRVGRDMPGSNWHMYFPDLDGNTHELYYGIEQIGWNGHSKPPAMHTLRSREAPELPWVSELQEVEEARARGVELLGGQRHVDPLPAVYDVDGVLLARPFKVVRVGPVSLFTPDVDAAEAFYHRWLGLTTAEEVRYEGQRCVVLRANTEHHSLALYPDGLRDAFDVPSRDTLASFGLQLATYRQLRNAVAFLRERGVTVFEPPPELHPGIDYAAYALDPEGHAMQLYFHMEQVGWDGRPRPPHLRRQVQVGRWPEILDALPDDYGGEPFPGPWG